jgi:hypothetical protein
VSRGGLWAKHIKARCYWEHYWGTNREHIKNLMGTHWEFEGNILGTKENGKISSSPPKNLKKKNQGTLSAC